MGDDLGLRETTARVRGVHMHEYWWMHAGDAAVRFSWKRPTLRVLDSSRRFLPGVDAEERAVGEIQTNRRGVSPCGGVAAHP